MCVGCLLSLAWLAAAAAGRSPLYITASRPSSVLDSSGSYLSLLLLQIWTEKEREREKLKGNKTVVILPIRFEQEEEEEERISCREREPLPTSVGPTVGQSVSDSTHLVDTFSIKKIKGRPVGGKSIPSSIHPGSCTFYKVEEFDFDFFRLVWLQPRKKNVYSFVTLRLSSFVVCGSQRQTRQEMPGVSIFHLFPLVLFYFIFSVLILFGVERKRQKRTGRGDRGRQEKFAFMIISGCFGSHI